MINYANLKYNFALFIIKIIIIQKINYYEINFILLKNYFI